MKRIRLTSVVFAAAVFCIAAFAASASAEPIFTLSSSFGKSGSGEGQISWPEGIDTDSKGNVWIADGENSRVSEFSSEGLYLGQITGTGEHKLVFPSDVAVDDSTGNVWVADSKGKELDEFSPKGEFIREAIASEIGAVWEPRTVAVDSKGNVWANGVFYQPNRILKFKPNGERDGKKEVIDANAGLMTDSEDHLWVTNPEKGRFDEFSSEGASLGSIGEGVLGIGVSDGTIDTEGNFWAFTGAWLAGNYVTGITAKGAYLAEFYDGYAELGGPHDLAPAANGNLWLALPINGNQIQKWTAAPKATTSAANAAETTLYGVVNPHGFETEYRFEYGTTTSYGSYVPLKSAGSGSSDIEVSAALPNLKSNTTYHYRIYASNSHGVTLGEDKSFTTPEWMIEFSPEPAGSTWAPAYGVSCVTSEACVAVGDLTVSGIGGGLAKVKSAGVWSLTTVPNPPSGPAFFEDVSCTTASACTAVGVGNGSFQSTLAERWNGSSWSIQSTPNASEAKTSWLWGVSCVASNNCTAVGWSTATGVVATLAEHWNGTSWSVMSTPNAPGYKKSYLLDVSCVSSSDCWAVGEASNSGSAEVALAEHWNGTTWSINSPTGVTQLRGISCASSSSCVATTSKDTVVARWNGSAWSQETAPKPEGATAAWFAGISCTSSSACQAVGAWGVKRGQPLAESWNGTKWSIEPTSEPPGTLNGAGFNAVSCISATSCAAAGSSEVKGSSTNKTLIEARH
jgi:NHL repeat-containing protein